MAQLTDAQCKGLTAGKRVSEPSDHGGSLLLWHRKGSKESKRVWYFRSQKDGSSTSERIGIYPSTTLVEARKLARTISKLANEVDDLKRHRVREKTQRKKDEEALQAEEARMNSLGTLEELCAVYVAKMRSEGAKSASKVEKALALYALKPHPSLAQKRANSITADDISNIISAMLEKGVTTHTNRTRGDLHAAFNVGLHFDHSPALHQGQTLRFDIEKNPVTRISRTKSFERILNRNLSAIDLGKVWHSAPEVMNPTYSRLLRVLVCTGLHPVELLRLNCAAVNVDDSSLHVDDTKAGNPIIVPLNKFALADVSALISGRRPDESLFPSRANAPISDAYARASVLSNQVKQLRGALPDLEHFTARDIRRTCKTLMGKAGISKEMRDRLQNHTFSDVSSTTYDVYDYWPEKMIAAKKWESWLDNHVIAPAQSNENVTFIGTERGFT
jgi:integrase